MYLALIPEEENTVIIKIDVQGFECKVSFMIVILGLIVLVLILERKLIIIIRTCNMNFIRLTYQPINYQLPFPGSIECFL